MNRIKVSKILFSLFFVFQAVRSCSAMKENVNPRREQESVENDDHYIIFKKNVNGKSKEVRFDLLGEMGIKNRDKKPFFIIDDSDSKVSLDDNLYEDFENMNRAAFYLFKHYGCLNFYRYRHYMKGNNADFLIGLAEDRMYICSLDSMERNFSVSRHASKIVKENLNKISSFRNLKRYGTQVFAHRLKNINHNQGSIVFLFDLKNYQYEEYCDKHEEDYKLFRLDNPYERIDFDFLEENSEDGILLVDHLKNDSTKSEYELSFSKNSDLEDEETTETTEIQPNFYMLIYDFIETGKNNRILKEYRPISLDDEYNNEKKGVVHINFGNDISVDSFGQQD